MPGRSVAIDNYRYSFNGKEDDSEWAKQDYGFRIYDKRIGRFLSVDPIARDYPELTPYQFASNTPIVAIDLDGLESAIKTRYLPDVVQSASNDSRVQISIQENQTVILRANIIYGQERLIEDVPIYKGESQSRGLIVGYSSNIPTDRYNYTGTFTYQEGVFNGSVTNSLPTKKPSLLAVGNALPEIPASRVETPKSITPAKDGGSTGGNVTGGEVLEGSVFTTELKRMVGIIE